MKTKDKRETIMVQSSLAVAQQFVQRPKLLVIEDKEDIGAQMQGALAEEYEVFLAEDRESALALLEREKPAVVTLDLGLPPRPREVQEGFLTLSDILRKDGTTKVIIITGRTDKEYALEGIGQGAYDFLCKPLQVDELKVILRRAFHVVHLEREHRQLQHHLYQAESFEGMLGTSPQIQETFSAVRKVATTDVPVMVEGESGTGKELVARAIHRQSARTNEPFVVINCGAIPENLLESELFGHEKGSFTGAHMQRKGRIEAAQNGVLFLDEIGELSPPLQVKLLRFLQEHKIERVGGRSEILVDARVIAATNIDLKRAMENARFREDLYYRLSVVVISVPPLRERTGDALLLAKSLLQKYTAESRKKLTGFTRHALTALETYNWPGNVRELENRIKRGVIMAEGQKVTAADLELDSPYTKYSGQGLKEARAALEKDFIVRTLVKNKGNISQVAAALGVSRPTLYDLMERLGIERR
jgi:two-component system, NtrC family, response regulator